MSWVTRVDLALQGDSGLKGFLGGLLDMKPEDLV